ncbi:MAG: MTH1187 family thiamine-binding protein [Planctomycetia bacterium]|nr:MTH1187 family thiamine-binding protein [Planctomycetia bacterium]
MALLEFSITPLGVGESVSKYVARCVDIIDKSGLDYRLHAMGTEVEGDVGPLLDLLTRCVEALAVDCDRVSVSAKLDYRKGHPGALAAKVASIEKRLGRAVKK